MTNKKKKDNPQSQASEAFHYTVWNSVAVFLLMVFNFALNFNTIEENDTWWHLKLGEWMIQNREFYRTEIFSRVAEGKVYIAYEWLSEVLFHYMRDTNGITLSVFKLVLMTIGFASVAWLLARPYWKSKFTFPVLMTFSFLMAFRAQVRPHLIGEWCTAFLVIGIYFWQKHWEIKRLWWLIPMQIFWANCHGSFMLGPALVFFWAGTLWFSQQFKFLPGDRKLIAPPNVAYKLAAFGFVLLACSMINPYGFGLIKKSFIMFFTHGYLREYIKEWHSILEFIGAYWLYFWALWMGWAWILLFKNKEEVSVVDLGTLTLATFFPFTGVRMVTLSAALTLPMILKFSGLNFPTGYRPKLMAAFLAPLIVLTFAFGYPQGPGAHREVGIGFSYKMVPLDIIQHIKSHKMKGVMMNDYDEGAFVIYYLFPDVKTVLDSRTELYEKELFEEHRDANQYYPDYQRYVQKYDVNLVMVRISNTVLRNALFNDPNWKLEKVGIGFDLFSRVTPENPKEDPKAELKAPPIETMTGLAATAYVDQKARYCIFVRLYGRCLQAPECAKECEYTDSNIAESLGLADPMCLKFSQACFKKETACGNCRPLCDHYKMAVPKMNKALHTSYPESPICN